MVLPLETLVSLLIIFFLYIGGGLWAERVAVRVLLPLRDPVTGSIHRDPETLPIGISLIVAPFQKAIGVRGNGAVRHLANACGLPADTLKVQCRHTRDTRETGMQTLSLGQASPPGDRVAWVWVHPAAVELVVAQVSLLVGRLSLAVLCVNLRC